MNKKNIRKKKRR